MADIRAWMKSSTKTAKDWFGVTGEINNEGTEDEVRPIHTKEVGVTTTKVGDIDAQNMLLRDSNGNQLNPSQVTGINSLTGSSSVRDVVAVAGTRKRLNATSTPCVGVFVQAFRINTNLVTVGFSDVVGTPDASRKGICSLESGDTAWIPVDNLNKLYIDSMVNGEGLMYTVFTRS